MAKSRKSPVESLNKSPVFGSVRNPMASQDATTAILEDYPEGVSDVFFDPKKFDPAYPLLRVKLQRLDDTEKRWMLHGYLEPTEATEGRIVELFGGGKYRVSAIVADSTGRQVIKTAMELKLPGLYKPPVSELPGCGPKVVPGPTIPDSAAVGAAGRSATSMSPREIVESLQVEQLVSLVSRGREVPRDYTPLVTAILGALSPILLKLFERDRDNPEARRLDESLQLLQVEVRALKNQPGPATNAISDVVKAMRELSETRELLTPERNPDDGLLGLGRDVLGLLRHQQ